MKKLLYISDQFKNSNHNFIESFFNGYLKKHFDVTLVYFSRGDFLKKEGNIITFPYKKRKRIHKEIKLDYDYVIVRNRFDILKRFTKLNRDFKLGFQLSFPHTFRRYYQAQMEKKSLIRKKIEYEIKNFLEKRLIKKCDFFLPITDTMQKIFYYEIKIPYFPLPLGADRNLLFNKETREDEKIRFIYIGSVDKLREMDTVLKAFSNIKKENFLLDIFTPNENYAKTLLQKERENINIYPSLPRKEIIKKLSSYDIGVALIPPTLLYIVSSPIKVMEYYSSSIPSLMSKIPECTQLFCNEKEGWLCDFDEKSIEETIKKILKTPKSEIKKMGERGREKLLKNRNYEKLSKNFYDFLNSL